MFNSIIKRKFAASILGVASLVLSSAAFALVSTAYSFVGVTNSNASNVDLGEISLSVEVIDLGNSQVEFKFTNTSSSTLTDVYFDDGTLLGIASISDSGANVSFSQGASPGDLPGGNALDPDFNATAGFTADSNPPTSKNGVTSGEWVAITFDLLPGQDYNSVIDALTLPNDGGVGDLRIGVRVQSFSNGGSESFVNVPGISAPVPEAQTYVMMLMGLGLVGFMVRRRSQPLVV